MSIKNTVSMTLHVTLRTDYDQYEHEARLVEQVLRERLDVAFFSVDEDSIKFRLTNPNATLRDRLMPDVYRLVVAGAKSNPLDAIRTVRRELGCSLAEARQIVEDWNV